MLFLVKKLYKSSIFSGAIFLFGVSFSIVLQSHGDIYIYREREREREIDINFSVYPIEDSNINNTLQLYLGNKDFTHNNLFYPWQNYYDRGFVKNLFLWLIDKCIIQKLPLWI